MRLFVTRALFVATLVAAAVGHGGWARAEAPGQAQAADEVDRLQAEVARLDGERAARELRREAMERAAVAEAREIGRLKAEPSGIARDLKLSPLLASSQERGQALERLAAEARAKDAELWARRRALVAACDRALDSRAPGTSGASPASPSLLPGEAARRAEISKLRAETAARLGLLRAAPMRIAPAQALDPLAGPSELDARADRMKDDEEKLAREAQRVLRRIASVEERRRVREGAAAVEEDLFIESGVGRSARRLNVPKAESLSDRFFGGGSAGTAASPNAAPGRSAGDGSGGSGALEAGAQSTMLRGVLDPSTVGDLQRAEAGGDAELELKALRQAEHDLAARAQGLARQEADLRRRAAALRNRK